MCDIICRDKQIERRKTVYIYQRLKDLREDNENKQSEIAELLQISQQQYSMYEKGKREIPLHLIIVLARYYKVSLDYITGLTNDKRGIGYKADSDSKYNITQQNNNSAVVKIKEK